MVVEKAVILVAAETMCQNMTEKQQVFQNLNPGESSAVLHSLDTDMRAHATIYTLLKAATDILALCLQCFDCASLRILIMISRCFSDPAEEWVGIVEGIRSGWMFAAATDAMSQLGLWEGRFVRDQKCYRLRYCFW